MSALSGIYSTTPLRYALNILTLVDERSGGKLPKSGIIEKYCITTTNRNLILIKHIEDFNGVVMTHEDTTVRLEVEHPTTGTKYHYDIGDKGVSIRDVFHPYTESEEDVIVHKLNGTPCIDPADTCNAIEIYHRYFSIYLMLKISGALFRIPYE